MTSTNTSCVQDNQRLASPDTTDRSEESCAYSSKPAIRGQSNHLPSVSTAEIVDVKKRQSGQSRYIQVRSRKPLLLSYCPSCSISMTGTRTHSKANRVTVACVIAGAIVFLPLCWVPLVWKETKQTNHYCQNCGTKVARVKPFQQ